MADWLRRIQQALERRRTQDAYRIREANSSGNGRWLLQGGRRYLNFASNDYLGLSRHPAVIRAWQEGAERYGVGSGGSSHVTGFSRAHAALEARLADWLGYPRALLAVSGYAANQAVIHALLAKGDRLLADKLSHASLLEAADRSPAHLRRFPHNRLDRLTNLLEQPVAEGGQTLVVTEGVFSMDGDGAPLAAIQSACQAQGAWLLVDDAHGIGLRGDQGRGSCQEQGVRPQLLVVTFGKAFGVGGAAILCDEPVAEYLLQFARHLIYSTALPAAQVEAVNAALTAIQQGDGLRARLRAHIARFRAGAKELPWTLADSASAIQPLLVGDNAQTLALAEGLRAGGLWLGAMRPPTVPPGSARLRITLSAAHEAEDIDLLLEGLRRARL